MRIFILKPFYNKKIMKKDTLLKKNKFPDSIQAILWSKDIKNADLCDDKIYIIHQILAYGDIREVKWLFKVYSENEVRNIFISYPARIYTKPIYYFIKNFILNIKEDINENDYIKIAPCSSCC